MNRGDLLIGLGALTLASCAGQEAVPGLTKVNGLSAIGKPRIRMSLPSGYTTSTSSSGTVHTTQLYYQGSLIAALSLDTSTWKTTIYDYIASESWTSTSPSGLQAGQVWQVTTNVSGTANSAGTELSGNVAGSTGYFYTSVDSNGDYYSEHYHPTFYSAAQRIETGIYVGGGNHCPPSGCPMGPDNAFACVTGIVGAAFGAVGMAASIAGLFTGALTALAVGGLVSSHILMLWSIAMIYADCM